MTQLGGEEDEMFTRRGLLAAGAGAAAALGGIRVAAAQPAPSLGPNRLVTLGTRGGPSIRTGFTPSPSANLIVFDNVAYVIDTGYGTSFKLVESKFPLPQLRYVFITHHHSDHNAEFGLLAYNSWSMGLKTPIDAYGPAGMKRLAQGFWDAYQFDIETRMADEGRPDLRKLVNAHEYTEGEVLKTDKVRVSALRNLHPPITESFALKFEFPGKTVVFSGDTAYHPPLAQFAKGADILVHEAMLGPAIAFIVRANPNAATMLKHLQESHTLVADVGRIATDAGVKTLVLSHFVPADAPNVTDQQWIDAVRETWKGELVLAKDLMEIRL
jgi:ribonuclease BN (tRNA processing enzyme)